MSDATDLPITGCWGTFTFASIDRLSYFRLRSSGPKLFMNPAVNIPRVTRRHFLHAAGTLAGVLASGRAPALLAAESPGSRVRVAVLGLGRGMDHIGTYLQIPNAEVACVCDVDERRVAGAVRKVQEKTGKAPLGVRDFRRVLDDRNIDAVSVALPNFWHAPATILACRAGKHVYVEKPGSHNAHEAGLMVAAARKYQRVVQMGNQRRSRPEIIEAIARLRAGEIGPVRAARSWYDATRPGIGRGHPAPVPDWLDYELWQGPIAPRPYVDNLVHYNWHWRWHWGGGELANNGIHALDVCRWGLGVEFPQRVTYTGGRYHFSDDQETPDTAVASYDFGHCTAIWDCSSCLPRENEKHSFVSFYGDGGVLALDSGSGYRIFETNGKERLSVVGKSGDLPHFTNFIEAIRTGVKLNSEIAEGQKSTLLCHLGNIAYRTGTSLAVNPRTGTIDGATSRMKQLWTREYRRGWEPKV